MGFWNRIFVPLCVFFVTCSAAVDAKPDSQSALDEMRLVLLDLEKFRTAAPSRAYELILKHRGSLDLLSPELQTRWWLATAGVTFQQGDSVLANEAMSQLIARKAHRIDQATANRLLMYTGHHGISLASYRVAKQAYACIDTKQSLSKAMGSVYAVSTVHHAEGLYQRAKDIKSQLLDLAEAIQSDAWIPTLYNSLGVAHLQLKNYAIAADYYQRAMDLHYQNASRNSEVIAGLNLLLTLVLAQENEPYQGLHSRVVRLTNLHSNDDLKTYLKWIELGHTAVNGAEIPTETLQAAQLELASLQDEFIAHPVKNYIYPLLGIEVPGVGTTPETHAMSELSWVTQILADLSCAPADQTDSIVDKQLAALMIQKDSAVAAH